MRATIRWCSQSHSCARRSDACNPATKRMADDVRTMDPRVDKARQGDVAAFEQLVREHYGAVYAVARGITGRDGDAEDATQDTFVRAWRAMPTFRGDAKFSTWLHRIATNVSLTLVTRRKDKATNDIPDSASMATSPEARMEDRERLSIVHSTMEQLPADARAAFVLRDVQGLTYDEIAETLGISLSAVKSRIFRARQTIADANEDLRHAGEFGMSAIPFGPGPADNSEFDDGIDRDPDDLGVDVLALVRDAAVLLQDAAVPRPAALEQTVKRVKLEAVLGAVLGTVGGSMGRVARAAPELLGLIEEDRPNEGPA